MGSSAKTRSQIRSGMYLAPPHGRLIFTGKKTALVKPREIKTLGPDILVSGKEAFGYIQLGEKRMINIKEFESLERFHRVRANERAKWWPDDKEFFYYPVVKFIKFKEPYKVILPPRVQTFIPEVKFAEVKGQRDFMEVDLEGLTKTSLVDFHNVLHDYYHGKVPEGATIEEVVGCHELVIAEMKHRRVNHPLWSDGMDRKFERVTASELMDSIPDRVELESYVYMAEDNSIMVQPETFKNALKDVLPGSIVFDDKGPQGESTPIYRMVLEKIKAAETRNPGDPYMVEQKKKYQFVIQYHVRGIPEDWSEDKIKNVLSGKEKTTEPLSIHADLRMKTNRNFLIGWTIATPGNLKKRDKLMNNQAKDNIVVIKKDSHRLKWLDAKGKIKPGEVGATKEAYGYIWPVAKGTLTYGVQKDDTHEYFLSPTFVAPGFKVETIKGRWQISEVPRGKLERVGEGKTFWQMTRPMDQKAYVETHDKDKEVEKAKKDRIMMIWQGPGVKPEKFNFK